MEDSILVDNRINYQEWPLDMLIRYIEKEHYRYVREQSIYINSALTDAYKQPHLYGILIIAHEFAMWLRLALNDFNNDLKFHIALEDKILFKFLQQ